MIFKAMRYKEPKPKAKPKAKSGLEPVRVQEYSVSKVYKLGELPKRAGKKNKKNKKVFLSKFSIKEVNPTVLKRRLKSALKTALTVYKKPDWQKRILTIFILLALFIGGLTFILIKYGGKKEGKPSKVMGTVSKVTVDCPGGDEKPKFDLLFPLGKNEKSLGGVCRTSPKTSAPVFTYRDVVNSVKVKVSQQVAPKGMLKEEDLASFAKQNYYNEMFMVNDTKVYAGMSARGEQFIVMVKNNLLIFITADKKIDNTEWVKYISVLK